MEEKSWCWKPEGGGGRSGIPRGPSDRLGLGTMAVPAGSAGEQLLELHGGFQRVFSSARGQRSSGSGGQAPVLTTPARTAAGSWPPTTRSFAHLFLGQLGLLVAGDRCASPNWSGMKGILLAHMTEKTRGGAGLRTQRKARRLRLSPSLLSPFLC